MRWRASSGRAGAARGRDRARLPTGLAARWPPTCGARGPSRRSRLRHGRLCGPWRRCRPAEPIRVVGQSAAGHGYAGRIGPARRCGSSPARPCRRCGRDPDPGERAPKATVYARSEPVAAGRHIRRAGLDFRDGEIGLVAGTRLNPAELALAAAMNHRCCRSCGGPGSPFSPPGTSWCRPGARPGPDQIVASNSFARPAIVEAAGGEPSTSASRATISSCSRGRFAGRGSAGADVLVTLGGASVGDHDLVQAALTREGMELGFWKIAMRPGKPLMHGRLGAMRIRPAGKPGLVDRLRPVLRAAAGARPLRRPAESGRGIRRSRRCWPSACRPTSRRQDYLRGTLAFADDGGLPLRDREQGAGFVHAPHPCRGRLPHRASTPRHPRHMPAIRAEKSSGSTASRRNDQLAEHIGNGYRSFTVCLFEFGRLASSDGRRVTGQVMLTRKQSELLRFIDGRAAGEAGVCRRPSTR